MGGTSIFRLKLQDPNLNVIMETITNHYSRKVMIQEYIPEISEGDKRILIIKGKPMAAAIARIPAEGELRGNLAAGGSAVAKPLSERDQWICDQVAPSLVKKGLDLVGLDVIGDYLTEINVTSPTCLENIKNYVVLMLQKYLSNILKTRFMNRVQPRKLWLLILE